MKKNAPLQTCFHEYRGEAGKRTVFSVALGMQCRRIFRMRPLQCSMCMPVGGNRGLLSLQPDAVQWPSLPRVFRMIAQRIAFAALFFMLGLACSVSNPATNHSTWSGFLFPVAKECVASPGGFPNLYTHYAEQEPLPSLLTDFARSQGLGASFSTGISGTVSGRFEGVAPEKFLLGMKAAFGVAWYRTGRTLHFYNESEASRSFISPRAMSAERLYRMLRESSVLSPQLPAELLPGGDMIVVSGPPAYLEQIAAAVSAFEDAQTNNFGMRVFSLKYAWAEDITVNSMDKTVTIPGVASILRAMVNGSPLSGARITQEPATVNKLGGTGLVAQGKQQPVAPGVPQAVSQESQGQQEQQGGPAVSIIADPRVNAVLVQDALYRMPYYESVIRDLDKPVELVEIHAAIVDIDVDFKRDLGVTYQGAVKNENGWSGGGDLSSSAKPFDPLPVPGSPTGAGLSLSTIYTHGSDYFLARVTALEKDGEARMLGRPSVLTVDNVQATLENTSTYYIEVQGYQAVDLFKVEAGTVLRVTPHIIRNEGEAATIKLAVNVQDDQSDNGRTPATNAGVPPIKQTKINTQAIVGAGQSLLIGGYYYEQKSTGAEGIPILKDIPVFGHLFKTTSKATKRMERLILITPRVVKLNDLPPPPARVDEPAFRRSPTQGDYEERIPSPDTGRGGCSRSNQSLSPPDMPRDSAMTVSGGASQSPVQARTLTQ